uniref:Uncharacterized protein n=3 Tax=Caenorhabditis japonica TaxID=281687 RepID=A0A8R1EAC3_CAEJA
MKNMQFIILPLIFCLFGFGATESISVRANVHCAHNKNSKPIVTLMEHDFGDVPILSWFDSDDLLDETKVDYGEHFTLDGNEIEVFSTEPYLRIYHSCFGVDQESVLDLSQFEPSPEGVYHLGHIKIKTDGLAVTN